MKASTLVRLSDLILDESAAVLHAWTDKVQCMPTAREVASPVLIDHMPKILEQIGHAIRTQEEPRITPATTNGNGSSKTHGALRYQAGFDIIEVVGEYSALREVVYEFAEQRQITIAGGVARILNRWIDQSIAVAVKAYATEKTIELQRRREEHISFLVHDLRTPIAAIDTAMWIVETKYKDLAERSAKFLDVVRRNVVRLNTLVGQVLQEHANLQGPITKLEKRELDVWPLVESLIRDFRPLAETAQSEVVNEIPEDLSVLADAQGLSRIFQNLLSNALKYTKHGKIVFSGTNLQCAKEFRVADTGVGIPPERIETIFEKLEKDPDDNGGMGLGLAIVREMVEAHGGTVSVISEVGKGSTFTFTIGTV